MYPRFRNEEAGNSDKHRQNKNLPQKSVSFSQRTNQIEIFQTIISPLPPDITEKVVTPTFASTSKGQVGSLDFHPHEAILRSSNTATKVVSEEVFIPVGG